MVRAAALASITAVLLSLCGTAQAAPVLGDQGHLRVIHAFTAHADQPLAVNVDGEPVGTAAWADATRWLAVTPGSHEIGISVGAHSAARTVEVPPGCRVSVLAAQPDVTTPTASLITAPDCTSRRIQPGLAQITTTWVANSDFGVVEVRIGGIAQSAVPLKPGPGALVPAGPTVVAVGTPGRDETFLAETSDLRAGAAYTLLWAGGGETPGRLTMLFDAAQAPDAPPPGHRYDTGDPAAGGPGLGWIHTLIVLAAALAALTGGVRRAGWRARHRELLLIALLAAGCSGPIGSSASHSHTAPGSAPSVPDAPAPSAPEPPSPPRQPTARTAIEPARARIAEIGVDQPIITMPTAAIGGLPDSLPLDEIAWIAGSALPGAVGTTALLGHTTAAGRGPFAALPALRPGDTIDITDAYHQVYRYVVRSAGIYAKTAFPAWIWAPQPVPVLVLITCTQQRDPSTGIADNYIVWATAAESRAG